MPTIWMTWKDTVNFYKSLNSLLIMFCKIIWPMQSQWYILMSFIGFDLSYDNEKNQSISFDIILYHILRMFHSDWMTAREYFTVRIPSSIYCKDRVSIYRCFNYFGEILTYLYYFFDIEEHFTDFNYYFETINGKSIIYNM